MNLNLLTQFKASRYNLGSLFYEIVSILNEKLGNKHIISMIQCANEFSLILGGWAYINLHNSSESTQNLIILCYKNQ